MTALICGSRDATDSQAIFRVLDEANVTLKIDRVIAGGARGVDDIAAAWAQDRDIQLTVCPADWKRYGKAAGPIRNRVMLTELIDEREAGIDVVVLAFPGGVGTENMVKQAEAAGVKVARLRSPRT